MSCFLEPKGRSVMKGEAAGACETYSMLPCSVKGNTSVSPNGSKAQATPAFPPF